MEQQSFSYKKCYKNLKHEKPSPNSLGQIPICPLNTKWINMQKLRKDVKSIAKIEYILGRWLKKTYICCEIRYNY